MAYPTAVNDQITDAVSTTVNPQVTDSVTQANVKVLGDAPAVAMGNLFVATSQALSNAAHNATSNQQQSYVTMQAATTQAVATLLTLDTASTGVATASLLDPADVLQGLSEVASKTRVHVDDAASTAAAAPDAGAEPDDAATPDLADAMRHLMEQFAASLDALNAVAVRQAIHQVALAAVTAYLARAGAVDPSAPNAAEQAQLFTGLAENTIRVMSAWAESLSH